MFLLPEMYVFTLVRKVYLVYKDFTRHLNVEYFESANTAIFLLYYISYFLLIGKAQESLRLRMTKNRIKKFIKNYAKKKTSFSNVIELRMCF